MNFVKNTKKGSYIVEAAMSLPVLILCIVAITLIINIISICENIGFCSAKEMHEICASAYNAKAGGTAGRIAVQRAVAAENPKIKNFAVTGFRYQFTYKDIDELVGLQTKANFGVENSIGIRGKIVFNQKLLARTFTGKLENSKPLSEEEFQRNEESVPVVIFPKYGVRFHLETCRYVKQNYRGEEYKIEMEKEDAKAKGYTPCSVCGGGIKNE